MTDSSNTEEEIPKTVPALTADQERIAYSEVEGDSATQEGKIYASGESFDDIKKQAAKREHVRAERFLDNFESISIKAMWMISIIFAILTCAWALHLILPKCYQFLDDNQEDKLQLIITGGFVAGVASSHIKKRLGG